MMGLKTKELKGIYLVTEDYAKGRLEYARDALQAGVRIIQLREKKASGKEFLRLAKEMKTLCETYNAVCIVNDRLDIALLSGADGVHVGQDDLPVEEIRKILDERIIVGVSVKNVEEAIEAERKGASYVAVSPVFDTLTKEDAGKGVGLDVLRQIKRQVRIPVVAIGGINRENMVEVLEAGADCVAVVSAITRAEDPTNAASELVRIFNDYYQGNLKRGELN